MDVEKSSGRSEPGIGQTSEPKQTIFSSLMSAEHAAFSASGEDAITRVIDVHTEEVPFNDEHFDEFYEIARTAEEIIKGDYKRVRSFPSHSL